VGGPWSLNKVAGEVVWFGSRGGKTKDITMLAKANTET